VITSSALRLSLLLPVFPVLPVLPVLHSQTRVSGRVVDADAVPVARARVLLHQVGERKPGPIDSNYSDARGKFQFAFRPDSGAFYLISTRFAGIEYFSSPVATRPTQGDSVSVVVYDTSSTTPVGVGARHLVVTRPSEDGSRSVLDLVVLNNSGRMTRVAPDSLSGSYTIALPAGSRGLQIREGDVSPGAVTRRGDTAIVSAALAPGEKQLTLEYQIPSGRDRVELPLSGPDLSLNVLLEESGAGVDGPGIRPTDSQEIQGRSFRRWSGTVTSPGALRIVFPRIGGAPQWLLATLVGSMALSLALAGWYRLTRAKVAPENLSSHELIDAIAALDARYRARQSETPTDEWSTYLTERHRLKARLQAALAADGKTS
jgi:hypothetical protein